MGCLRFPLQNICQSFSVLYWNSPIAWFLCNRSNKGKKCMYSIVRIYTIYIFTWIECHTCICGRAKCTSIEPSVILPMQYFENRHACSVAEFTSAVKHLHCSNSVDSTQYICFFSSFDLFFCVWHTYINITVVFFCAIVGYRRP